MSDFKNLILEKWLFCEQVMLIFFIFKYFKWVFRVILNYAFSFSKIIIMYSDSVSWLRRWLYFSKQEMLAHHNVSMFFFFTILEAFNLKILENRGCLCVFSVTVDFFVRFLFLCLTVSTVFMELVVCCWGESLSAVPFKVDLPLYHLQNFRGCPVYL